MKKIVILNTGGTIVSSITENGLSPGMSTEEFAEHIPRPGDRVQLEIIQLCNIDSTNFTPAHWILIVNYVKENYDKYDGFLICHGTDTMAYTAAALSYMIQDSPKPIVITGAQKPIHYDITDAKANLRDSLEYVMDEDSCGVQVVFDGAVIAGTRAKKTKTVSYHAFSSINYPFLALIQDSKILRYIQPNTCSKEVKFYTDLNEKVFLLKLIPGIKPYILPAVFEHYDCIIVESFGVGGIPDSVLDEFSDHLKKYPENEKIIVLTTQVLQEGSNVGVYQVGNRLKGHFRYLEAYDMNLEAVVAKMMWIMGIKGITFSEIEKLFYSEINYDTVFG